MSKICPRCKKDRPLDHFTSKTCLICKKKNTKYEQKNWHSRMVIDSRKKDKKNFGDKTTTVTKEYILNQHKLQNNECYYCNCQMEYGIGTTRFHNPFAITLERISSDLPHTNSNCVLICWDCNMMKNSSEFRNFIEKCTYISNKFKYVFD